MRGPLGVLSAADLMVSEAHSPFALRYSILRASNEDELVAAAAKLSSLFLALHSAELSPGDIGRVLTLQFESLTARLIDLTIEAHGPAPVAWAWLALGSAARREFTLASDQENALAYADVDSGQHGRRVLRAVRGRRQPRSRPLRFPAGCEQRPGRARALAHVGERLDDASSRIV